MSDPPPWAPPGEDPAGERAGPPSEAAAAPATATSPPPWGPGWHTEVKPGVVPLRPLALLEILDGAFTTIRRQPRLILGLAAGVAVAELVVAALVGGLLGDVGTAFGVQEFDPNAPGFDLRGSVPALIGALVAAVLAAVYTGMLTVIVAEAVLGRASTLRSVWGRVRPRTWALLGAALLAGLLPWVGLLAFVIGGVFLWGALALTMPALMLERCGVRQALRRSWRLAVPDWWRVFGVRALSAVIAFAVTMVLTTPAGAITVFSVFAGATEDTVSTGVLGPVLLALSEALATILSMPFTAGVLTLLYVDRRMRAEGLDLALAAAAADTPGAPPTATAPPLS